MNIGLFGGAFDPPHFGHLFLAEQAREDLGLDKVIFVPTGQAVHKDVSVTDTLHRHRMVYLATDSNDAFSFSTWEMGEDRPSYTIETIHHFASEHPGASLHLIVGADHADLRGWKEADTIRRLMTVWHGDRTLHSSSNIRERVRNGLSIRYLVPDSIMHYIDLYDLYSLPKPTSSKLTEVHW